MPLKHPIRCLSAGFNHAGSRPVAQEIRASPSCSAASGRRHRDEGGSHDDPSGRVSATRLTASVPGMARRLASSPHLNCGPSCRWPTNSASRARHGGADGTKVRRVGWRLVASCGMLLGVAAAVVAPASAASASVPTQFWVSQTALPTGADRSCPTAAYATVQSAVLAAEAAETLSSRTVPTIEICPGTYAEQVTILKSLVLTRAPGRGRPRPGHHRASGGRRQQPGSRPVNHELPSR